MVNNTVRKFEVNAASAASALSTTGSADFSSAAMRNILLELGMKPSHVEIAVRRQEQTKESIAQIMRDFGFLSGEGVAQAVSMQTKLEYFPAEDIDKIDKQALSAITMPEYKPYVPVGFINKDGYRVLLIAVSDAKYVSEATNAFRTYKSEVVIASEHTIQTVFRKYFAQTAAAFDGFVKKFDEHSQRNKKDDDDAALSLIRDIYFSLIRHACYSGASDLYLAKSEHVGIIKLKINGVGQMFRTVSIELYDRILNKMAQDNVKVDELRIKPKEAIISMTDDEREKYPDIATRFNMRLELTESRGNRGAVIRILDKNAAATDLERLGFDPDTYNKVLKISNSPTGFFIVTGPTGSGKTTTMYAVLKKIDPVERSVQSIENPIEYTHGLWHQFEVRKDSDNEAEDYNEWLKALLRNAPDVILIGEVRDKHVAHICLNAANTGHLVLASLHTNDAPLAIYRLKDLEVDMSVLSAVLLGILAQRLVRMLCNSCKVEDTDSHVQEELNVFNSLENKQRYKAYKAGDGCPNCDYTGYRGRNMIYELFEMNSKVRELLEQSAHPSEIALMGLPANRSMWSSGLKLIQQGKTSMAELIRCAPRPAIDLWLEKEADARSRAQKSVSTNSPKEPVQIANPANYVTPPSAVQQEVVVQPIVVEDTQTKPVIVEKLNTPVKSAPSTPVAPHKPVQRFEVKAPSILDVADKTQSKPASEAQPSNATPSNNVEKSGNSGSKPKQRRRHWNGNR